MYDRVRVFGLERRTGGGRGTDDGFVALHLVWKVDTDATDWVLRDPVQEEGDVQ